eukprot:7156930-Alexandrium_andersonii.AAC.1
MRHERTPNARAGWRKAAGARAGALKGRWGAAGARAASMARARGRMGRIASMRVRGHVRELTEPARVRVEASLANAGTRAGALRLSSTRGHA